MGCGGQQQNPAPLGNEDALRTLERKLCGP